MIEFIRSLPQGMFWYPFLGFLVFSLVRAIWSVREGVRRRRPPADGLDRVDSVAALVRRAVTDQFAEQELQRRCIGMLLQLHGYGGYSVENCRSYLAGGPSPEVRSAIESHLERQDRQSPRRTTGDGVLSRETQIIITRIEALTEAEQ